MNYDSPRPLILHDPGDSRVSIKRNATDSLSFTRNTAFGFLTGFNVCPPLLLAISYAFGLGSPGGLLLFAGFFAGTSAYLALLLPLGLLGRWRTVRLIALMTAALSGAFFLLVGIARILAL